MSTSAVFIYALYGLKKRNPEISLFRWMYWLWIGFKLPYIAIYMTILETHYFIDFTTGLAIGILCGIWAEKCSYFFDVLICGRPNNKRDSVYYAACGRCGWANRTGILYIDADEKRS